jgi:hypothetical protein
MYATLAHSLAVVDMLRRERAVLADKHLYQQQQHCRSKQNTANYEYMHHFPSAKVHKIFEKQQLFLFF